MTKPNVLAEQEAARVPALTPEQRQKERRMAWILGGVLLLIAVPKQN